MKELITLDEARMIITDKGVRKVAIAMKAEEFKEDYRKQYPESTAKERKLAFEQYVREQSQEIAQSINLARMMSLIEQGKLGVKRVAINKKQTEMTTVFIDLSNTAKPQEIKAQMESMSEADLKELVTYLQEKLAKEYQESSANGETFQNLLKQ